MITPTFDVTSRIAMLESRFGSIEARVGNMRGGGRVGAGMADALAKATEAAGSAAPQPVTSAAQPIATSLGGVTAVASTASAAPAAPAGQAGEWATRLPAAGREWAPAIEAAATKHGLEPELLAGLVWTESNFDPGARSPSGAIGLGQLMPGTAAGLGVDPTNPEQNLDGAARYLREQIDRFGDRKLALAAYNAGPGRVARAGGVPNITETVNYVQRVTTRTATLGGR